MPISGVLRLRVVGGAFVDLPLLVALSPSGSEADVAAALTVAARNESTRITGDGDGGIDSAVGAGAADDTAAGASSHDSTGDAMHGPYMRFISGAPIRVHHDRASGSATAGAAAVIPSVSCAWLVQQLAALQLTSVRCGRPNVCSCMEPACACVSIHVHTHSLSGVCSFEGRPVRRDGSCPWGTSAMTPAHVAAYIFTFSQPRARMHSLVDACAYFTQMHPGAILRGLGRVAHRVQLHLPPAGHACPAQCVEFLLPDAPNTTIISDVRLATGVHNLEMHSLSMAEEESGASPRGIEIRRTPTPSGTPTTPGEVGRFFVLSQVASGAAPVGMDAMALVTLARGHRLSSGRIVCTFDADQHAAHLLQELSDGDVAMTRVDGLGWDWTSRSSDSATPARVSLSSVVLLDPTSGQCVDFNLRRDAIRVACAPLLDSDAAAVDATAALCSELLSSARVSADSSLRRLDTHSITDTDFDEVAGHVPLQLAALSPTLAADSSRYTPMSAIVRPVHAGGSEQRLDEDGSASASGASASASDVRLHTPAASDASHEPTDVSVHVTASPAAASDRRVDAQLSPAPLMTTVPDVTSMDHALQSNGGGGHELHRPAATRSKASSSVDAAMPPVQPSMQESLPPGQPLFTSNAEAASISAAGGASAAHDGNDAGHVQPSTASTASSRRASRYMESTGDVEVDKQRARKLRESLSKALEEATELTASATPAARQARTSMAGGVAGTADGGSSGGRRTSALVGGSPGSTPAPPMSTSPAPPMMALDAAAALKPKDALRAALAVAARPEATVTRLNRANTSDIMEAARAVAVAKQVASRRASEAKAKAMEPLGEDASIVDDGASDAPSFSNSSAGPAYVTSSSTVSGVLPAGDSVVLAVPVPQMASALDPSASIPPTSIASSTTGVAVAPARQPAISAPASSVAASRVDRIALAKASTSATGAASVTASSAPGQPDIVPRPLTQSFDAALLSERVYQRILGEDETDRLAFSYLYYGSTVTKRGHLLSTWRRRWFVLEGIKVTYYVDKCATDFPPTSGAAGSLAAAAAAAASASGEEDADAAGKQPGVLSDSLTALLAAAAQVVHTALTATPELDPLDHADMHTSVVEDVDIRPAALASLMVDVPWPLEPPIPPQAITPDAAQQALHEEHAGRKKGEFVLGPNSRAWPVAIVGKGHAFCVTTTNAEKPFLCASSSVAGRREWVRVTQHNIRVRQMWERRKTLWKAAMTAAGADVTAAAGFRGVVRVPVMSIALDYGNAPEAPSL